MDNGPIVVMMQTSEKNKAADPSLNDCANCGMTGAKLTCAKCKATHYCSKACQKQHWKNGHKAACFTPEERRPHMVASDMDTKNRRPTADGEGNSGECPICLDSISGGVLCTLPCKHEFHIDCVEELRKQGVQQVCPLCRTILPPGPAKLYEDATRLFARTEGRHRATQLESWKPQTASEERNLAKVVEMWTSAANQGYVRAQHLLGLHYQTGRGLTQDYEKGVRWCRKAADQGLANAQYSLGASYQKGEGVAQDYYEAVRWCRKAADQGLVDAQYSLGANYQKGEGIAQDYNEAVRWYLKAAEQGDGRAQYSLGASYQKGEGVAQDYNVAVRWYRKAADQGNIHAQYKLGIMYHGVMYDNGRGVAQDHSEARWWYRKAADQGHIYAQFNLGVLYCDGVGVAQDYNEAVRWYRKAADQGSAKAQLSIGIMYDNGEGIAQDYNEAVRWYLKAAEQGDGRAQYYLGVMYMEGKGVAQNRKKATFYFAAAKKRKDAEESDKAHALHKQGTQQTEAAPHDTSGVCPGLDTAPSQCTCCGRSAGDGVKLKPCPRCKGPLYCGKDCQLAHWKEGHKECCTPK